MNDAITLGPAQERLLAPGPKRMLALDGGGVRGVVTIEFLKALEARLRAATGRADLVLSDVFDLIGGASVGALTAALVARGEEMARVDDLFGAFVRRVFEDGEATIIGEKRYDSNKLRRIIEGEVGEETLDSPSLKTGFLLVAKRTDTGSPWILSNNPKAPYWDDMAGPDGVVTRGNHAYRLSRLLQASAAAPFYFDPVKIRVVEPAPGVKAIDGEFVDGGASPHNNPSIAMLQHVTFERLGLRWETGADKMLIISVGTGFCRAPLLPDRPPLLSWPIRTALGARRVEHIQKASHAAECLRGVIADAQLHALSLLQTWSKPRFRWVLNSEIGDLANDFWPLAGGDALFTFQRYDLALERNRLPAEFDVAFDPDPAEDSALRAACVAMDDLANVERLRPHAAAAAAKQVSAEDFDGFL